MRGTKPQTAPDEAKQGEKVSNNWTIINNVISSMKNIFLRGLRTSYVKGKQRTYGPQS